MLTSPARLLPRSLMQRLALVANGELLPVPVAPGLPARRANYLRTLLWFVLGVLAGGVVGGVGFLGLQAYAEMRMGADRAPAGLAEATPSETYDVAIDRSQRRRAPLNLDVAGTDDAGIQIILHGLPAGAKPSRGERLGTATWMLKRADLNGLHLSLGDATPDVFEMRIGVAAPAGVATQSSLVRVHLVDRTLPSQPAPVTGTDQKADETTAGADVAKLPAPRAGDDDKVARAQPRTPADASATVSQPASKAQPWPEGASGLGAVPRDSERQVWWSMPPPSWSPFQDAAKQP